MNIVPGVSTDSTGLSSRDVTVTDVLNLETPRIMAGFSPSASIFSNTFLTNEVPSTAEIIQKCLAVNPFEVKFREANRRLSQGQDGNDPNGFMGSSMGIPSSAGLSVLKLSQSPTIFSNFLSANDFELSRKMRESGLMGNAKDGNHTPCTADVLNAVLDMNMNPHHHHMAAVANAAASNNQQHQNSSVSTLVSEPGSLGFSFPVTSSNAKISQPQAIPPAMSAPPATVSLAQAQQQQQPNEIVLANSTLTALQSAAPASNVVNITSTSVREQEDGESLLNIDAAWGENEMKPDLSRRLGLPETTQANNYYASDDSNFSANSSVSNSVASQPATRDEPVKTTRKYHSRVTDGQTAHRGGRGRRSITSEMPPDERRQTILERNKAAAVRYRKRKKEEHDDMIGRVTNLEQDKNALQTQNSVLRQELERLKELIKLRESQCICHASQINTNNLLQTIPENSTMNHNNSFVNLGRQNAN